MSTTNKGGRVLKSAIAVGGATAILLGGYGAFSLWSDTETIGSGTLTAGSLDFATKSGAGWTLTKTDGVIPQGTAVADPSAFIASPGDELTYTATLEVTLKGSDLVADITINETDLVPTNVADVVDVTLGLATPAPTGVSVEGDAIRVKGNAAGTAVEVPVTVVIDFDDAAPSLPATPNDSQNKNLVNLGNLKFNLTQFTGTPTPAPTPTA